MQKPIFILRPMQLSDIGSAMKLSNAEGWNQTEKDWKVFLEMPENICMVAEYDNRIIGTTTAINYSNQTAWIGMVLVDKEYRGRGVSKTLLANVLKKLESFKSVKLDATPEGKQVYNKFDFRDEYLIARMINPSMKSLPADDDHDVLTQSIGEKYIREIIALDETVFGANRAQLIKTLIKENPGKAWMVKQNERVTGFALGRDGYKYHHIGPVVAFGTKEAKIIISKALRNLSNQSVAVDVLYDKEDLLAWLTSIGFKKQRHFIRMYKKENPFPGETGKQYLICGPEFG
jgi:GNAT superfamily N-acetyltransferase